MQTAALRSTKQTKNTMDTNGGSLISIGRTNLDPNIFLQKCKQQTFDKLKEVKTPWVLVGTLNSNHSMSV